MKKLLAAVACLMLASTAALAEKWTGYISDAQCAASGSKAKKAADWINPDAFEACAQKCAKNGSPLVFVTEDNQVLQLDADSTKKALTHLGHRVSLSGKVENGVLKVNSISNIKMTTRPKSDKDDVESHMHDKR
ncbi:MAG TPA: hypothetical protein VNW97_08945 [Candidatus Saccharimonadales bacterium]|nr:hypothetical protein [Candidatus Saccharimonadales bacterium]